MRFAPRSSGQITSAFDCGVTWRSNYRLPYSMQNRIVKNVLRAWFGESLLSINYEKT